MPVDRRIGLKLVTIANASCSSMHAQSLFIRYELPHAMHFRLERHRHRDFSFAVLSPRSIHRALHFASCSRASWLREEEQNI
jgi:hypothetical protein